MLPEQKIVVYLLVIIIVEVLFDMILWANDRSDKPASTLLRAMFVIGGVVAFQFGAGVAFWRSLVFFLTWYFVIFDYFINIVRGLKPWHVGNQEVAYERLRYMAGPWIELFLKIVFFMVGYGVMFRHEWI